MIYFSNSECGYEQQRLLFRNFVNGLKERPIAFPYTFLTFNERQLILECRLLHTIEIGLHTQFISEIVDVKADETVLGENGLPDAGKVQTFSYDPGSRCNYGTGFRLAQAFDVGRELLTDSDTCP